MPTKQQQKVRHPLSSAKRQLLGRRYLHIIAQVAGTPNRFRNDSAIGKSMTVLASWAAHLCPRQPPGPAANADASEIFITWLTADVFARPGSCR